jgi:hypothetical protein
MNPKQFLLEECANIDLVLGEMLSRDYLAGGAADFHRELTQRLEILRRMIAPIGASDPDPISLFSGEVSQLAELAHRIERSHAGEFSWPFAEELRALTDPLCQEDLRTPGREPIIRILAEGGLAAYRIHLEDDLSRIQFDRRIFTIVFPRTLKHHVLSHAIFGHEIGHAAWSIPRLRSRLSKEVSQRMFSAGPLSSVTNARYWLSNNNAPQEVREVIAQYGWRPEDLDQIVLTSWHEEILCDLFGLLTFGPAFLAAHQALLSTVDPHGFSFGDYHPPYVTRRAMLRQAVEFLGWHKNPEGSDGPLGGALDRFWNAQLDDARTVGWADVVDLSQLTPAIQGLQNILSDVKGVLFTYPPAIDLNHVLFMLEAGIPPCGADLTGAEVPQLRDINFRTILFSGWVRWYCEPAAVDMTAHDPRFSRINRLCERGMLQQRAINLVTARAEFKS